MVRGAPDSCAFLQITALIARPPTRLSAPGAALAPDRRTAGDLLGSWRIAVPGPTLSPSPDLPTGSRTLTPVCDLPRPLARFNVTKGYGFITPDQGGPGWWGKRQACWREGGARQV